MFNLKTSSKYVTTSGVFGTCGKEKKRNEGKIKEKFSPIIWFEKKEERNI